MPHHDAPSSGPIPLYRAQLATLADEPPESAQFLHEIKFDGYRIGATIENGRVRLESRNGQDWTAAFPQVVEALGTLSVRAAQLDGEVAMQLPDGRTSFQALQRRDRQGAGRLVYFVFDLLHLDGRDVARLPLDQRKAELEQLLNSAEELDRTRLVYSQHFLTAGHELFARACKLGLEGIICKRRDKAYRPGRNPDWLKVKCVKRQEFVVGGFTDPEGSRQGLGALLIGYYEGSQLRFAGKVGTGKGFTATYTAELRRVFEQLEQAECPFSPRPPGALGRRAHWVRPQRVAEVQYTELTQSGGVRHPSLIAFRDDKPASAVQLERALESGAAPPSAPEPRDRAAAKRAPKSRARRNR